MKSWLQDKDIEINSTHSERKFVIAEIFIRNLTITSFRGSKISPGVFCFVTLAVHSNLI